ncbi:MAG: sulfite exporter TauE/SafE family protein, partial [Candidatus Krumholzibacteria bacterium]|nr:sulfite exporter TauE/SafE family protein [Candidatus Krumholzibacteria bacterium]
MGELLWLIPLGFAVGTLGTLIGAGGGFVLMPVLLLLYPESDPGTVTAVSLAVVCLNTASGSWAYARARRIDFRSGLLFAAATIPGAVAGALTTDWIPRRGFNGIFGVVMIAAAAYLVLHRPRGPATARGAAARLTTRALVDAYGIEHRYSYSMRLGMWISLLVGYLSSLLGIGGGVIHVPALLRLLDFPV